MLGGFFKQLIGDANSPQNIAGTANFLNPGSFSQALLQATAQQNQQQHNQLQQYKQQMEQQQALKRQQTMGKLAELIGTGAKPEDINKELLNSGLEHADLSALSKLLTPDLVDKFNPVTGEAVRFQNGLAQGVPVAGQSSPMQQTAQATNGPNSAVSPVGGNSHGNTPVGQKAAFEAALPTAAERTAQEKAGKEEQAATKEASIALENLDQYEKAYKALQKNPLAANPGSLAQRIPGVSQATNFGSDVLAGNNKAQGAVDIMKKVKGQLSTALFNRAQARNESTQEFLIDSLPDARSQPEAFEAFIAQQRANLTRDALEGEFTKYWRHYNNNSNAGASVNFDEFIQNIPVESLTSKDRKELIRKIPRYIKELRDTGGILEAPEHSVNQDDLGFEDIDAAIARLQR